MSLCCRVSGLVEAPLLVLEVWSQRYDYIEFLSWHGFSEQSLDDAGYRTYLRSTWPRETRHASSARSRLNWTPHNVASRMERLRLRWQVLRSQCVEWLSVLMDRRTVQAFDSSEHISMIPRWRFCFSTSESWLHLKLV